MSKPKHPDPFAEKRARLMAYHAECDDVDDALEAWEESGYRGPSPEYPPFPEECADLTCGARTRAGTPCKRMDLGNGLRCRLHGGMSTGPRTKRGKRRSSKNARKKRTP